MKKGLKISFLMLFVAICCSACNGNITRDIRHGGYSIAGEFKCSAFYPKNKDDTNYEKIKYFLGSYAITEKGKIYELSLSQKYSSGEYCREAKTDIDVVTIMDGSIVKSSDGNYYSLVADRDTAVYSAITDENKLHLYNLLMKDDDIVKVMTVDNNNGIYYILKTDGNVYNYTLSKSNFNTLPEVLSISIAYDKSDYDGGIIDFNYAGDESLSTFILTNSKLYRVRVTNLEKCSKFADVACKYKLKEDTTYAKYKDKIIAYNGSTMITNYKKMFSVSY